MIRSLIMSAALCTVASGALTADVSFVESNSQTNSPLTGLWPVVDQNIQNSGVTPFEHILNINNVSQLVRGWSNYQYGQDIAVQAHPSVSHDGVAYYTDSQGNVTALKADTGELVWQTNLPGQYFVITPALTDDFVYVANSSVFCLDRQTGAVIWTTPINTGHMPYCGNPTIVENLLILGVGSFENDFPPPYYNRGAVIAYDLHTGAVVWEQWNTSDQTLPNPTYGPGAGSYSTAGIDESHHTLYIGTGNAYTGTAGPLTDSLLAIDYHSGNLLWSYQYTANDVWNAFDTGLAPGTFDLDVDTHPNIFSIHTNHGPLDLVGAGAKSGHYMIFNRHQSDPTSVKPLVDIILDPGAQFGGMQGCAVVKDGILYISSQAYVDQNGDRVSLDYLTIPGQQIESVLAYVFYGSLKTMALDISKLIAAGNTGGAIPEEAIIWTNVTQGLVSANPLSFANGVLYQASFAGWVRALDPATGAELWRDTPVPVIDPVNLPFPGFITTGVTVANGRLYVGIGLDELGQGFPIGGIVSYQLPGCGDSRDD